jgi:hypothetical protein
LDLEQLGIDFLGVQRQDGTARRTCLTNRQKNTPSGSKSSLPAALMLDPRNRQQCWI